MKSKDILVLCLVFLGVLLVRIPHIWTTPWVNYILLPAIFLILPIGISWWFYRKERRLHVFMLPLAVAASLAAYYLFSNSVAPAMVMYSYLGGLVLAYYLRPLERL